MRTGAWIRILCALACLAFLYAEIRRECIQHSWLGALWILILCIGAASGFFPMQTRRVLMLLFGRIEYVDEVPSKLEGCIRQRYGTEMGQLTDLGFTLLFFQGQTFPIMRMLLIFPAIVLSVMFFNREVIGLYNRTRLIAGHAILASEDRTTYAQTLRLGVMFSTSFQSGLVLISCNYGYDNLTWKHYIRHAHRGQSIGSTWAEHQRSIKKLELEGNSVDRQMSFTKFVDMVG